MISDLGAPVRRPRRPRWRRNPRTTVAGIGAAVIGSLILSGPVYGALGAGQSAHVTVHSGDTIWSIAAAHYSNGDVRDHVDQIIALNHLPGGVINPGEDLLLPAP